MSDISVIAESASLAPVSAAKELIARAVSEGDAETLVELRGQASAVELYHRRGGARDLANDAGEIKVRAERGLGQIDSEAAPHGGDRSGQDSGTGILLGTRTETRAAWRKLGKIAEPRFSHLIDLGIPA